MNDQNYLKEELYELIKNDESIFDFIQETSLDGLWYWDLENPEEEWMNPKFWTVLGYNPDEMPHKSTAWQNIINQDDLKVAIENFTRHCEDPDHPYDQTVRYTHKNGSTVWVRCRGMAIRDESGKAVRMLGAHVDITDIKEKEAFLRESEQRFEQVAQQSRSFTWEIDTNGLYTYVSGTVVSILGYTPEELVGKMRFFDLHPEPGREVFTERAFEVFARKERFNDVDNEAETKSGERIWLSTNGVPLLDKNGNLIGYQGNDTDITERRKNEDRLRILGCIAESESTMVLVTDANRRTEWANEAFWRGTGYRPEDIVGKNPGEILQGPDPDLELKNRMRKAFDAGKSFQCDILNYAKNGTPYWIHMDVQPVYDPNGSLTHFVSVQQDITDRRRAEQEIQSTNRQLRDEKDRANALAEEAERANKAKSAFLATMSHEIRTPMNSVIGMTSLLLNSDLSTEQREYTETIRTSGDALLSLINDILDFSKIESDRIVLEEATFDLSECIVEPLEIMAALAREKRIELTYEIDAEAPNSLVGDATRIRQILLNLVSNAVKFSEEDSTVTLRADCRRRPDGQWDLRVAVTDTGIGISGEARNNLFQPFEQADSSITRRYGGSGLGLAISQRLARLMGGDLECESEEGEGSTFRLHVPLQSGSIRGKVFERRDDEKLDGRKILVVDDNVVNRRLFRAETGAWGMNVREAASAGKALEVGAGFSPDIVLTDYQMPDFSGEELAREVRKRPWGNIPIVLCSSITLDRAELPPDLFAGILLKPVRQSALFNTLIHCLNGNNGSNGKEGDVHLRHDIEGDLAARHPLDILVAEDNPMNLRVIGHILKKMGYQADTAGHGEEAIVALHRQKYDLVLMDLEMPVMGGLEATAMIRENVSPDRQPFIVALTAHVVGDQLRECLEGGMDDYLAKPIKIPELSRVIREAARRLAEDPGEGGEGSGPVETEIAAHPSRIDARHLRDIGVESDDRETMESLLEGFGSILEESLEGLKAAADDGDAVRARKALHFLAGSAANTGMTGLAEKLRVIRKRMKENGEPPQADDREAIREEARQTLRAFRESGWVSDSFEW